MGDDCRNVPVGLLTSLLVAGGASALYKHKTLSCYIGMSAAQREIVFDMARALGPAANRVYVSSTNRTEGWHGKAKAVDFSANFSNQQYLYRGFDNLRKSGYRGGLFIGSKKLTANREADLHVHADKRPGRLHGVEVGRSPAKILPWKPSYDAILRAEYGVTVPDTEDPPDSIMDGLWSDISPAIWLAAGGLLLYLWFKD